MSLPTLVLAHGWGFDATLWDGLRAALPDFPAVAWDRGYFGAATMPPVSGPVIAIGHSLGALSLARDAPAECVGLVAINGFDRFAGQDAVSPRLLARMRARFALAPAEVLADFRSRIGAGPAPAIADADALAADLALLAEADARGLAKVPLLVLHGAADPLLPAAMRGAVFEGARRETMAEAGHLLPLTHARWCAERIGAFAE